MPRQMRRMRQNVVILAIQRQNNIHRRKRKTMWVYPRPQFWFEQLVVNRYQDHLWREHFRVSRDTFEHICGLVGPELVRQNTILRQAISIETRVAVALWRLATGNSYRTVGLNLWNRSMHCYECKGRILFCLVAKSERLYQISQDRGRN